MNRFKVAWLVLIACLLFSYINTAYPKPVFLIDGELPKAKVNMCLSISAAFLCGTLIVAIPTNEGWVVAADSRSTNSDKTMHCDDAQKLIEAPDSTVIAATGLRAIMDRDENADWQASGVADHIWLR